MDTNNSRMELLQDRVYPFSVPTFACFHFGEKLLFTVRDSLRGRRSKGMEKGIWARDAPEIPIPFPFECLPRRLCSLYRHEHKVRK